MTTATVASKKMQTAHDESKPHESWRQECCLALLAMKAVWLRPLILIALVFVGEAFSHLVSSLFPPMSVAASALLDAALLVVLVLPAVVLLLVRPLALQIESLNEAQEDAAARARELASIVETTTESILITGLDGVIRYANRSWELASGWTREEVVGKVTPRILKSGRHGPEVYERLWDTVTRGEVFEAELTNQRKDGSLYVVESIISPLKNPDGRVLGYAGIERDVTGRQKAQAALEKSAAEISDLYDHAPCGYHSLDGEGRVLRMNATELFWLGYPREEVLGRRYTDFLSEKSRAGFKAGFPRLMERGEMRDVEMEIVRKDGSVMPLLLNASAVYDERGTFIMSRTVLLDFSEQRLARERAAALEAQLRQAQKMEAIGRLAGGIAHDFNNVLTGIAGYSHFLLERLEPGDPSRADAEEIKKAGERASALTRQLLAFSRKQVIQPKDLDLNAVALDFERMLRRVIGEDVTLRVVPSPEPAFVHADPCNLEQVLMNLAVNARDAMPGGGRLTIAVRGTRVDKDIVHEHGTIPPGEYVELCVADTGAGMTPEVRAHVFEPFFTTKETGKGTGLGLSTVYGIVTQSGGHIAVDSAPGTETRFRIYLSRVARASGASEPRAAAKPRFRGTATILVVEDEEALRTLAHRALTGDGLNTLEAADAAEGASFCGPSGPRIDLALIDMVMPGLGGHEFAERFASAHPEAKIVFMSGHTDHAVLEQQVLARGIPFLQKPFAPEALVHAVREVLSEGGR